MIAGMTFYQIAWYFLLYSFAGWCTEVIFHAAKIGKVINRGFLCGPLCPVYGFGALAVFALTKSDLTDRIGMTESWLAEGDNLLSIAVVFIFGVILATIVELIAGWLLDVLFHARWWDYSQEPFNFHGYICLRFSLLWGAAVVLVVRVIQPAAEAQYQIQMPEEIGWPILGVLYLIFTLDLIVTVMMVAGFNRKLSELEDLQEELSSVSDALSRKLGTDTIKVHQDMEKARGQAEAARRELEEKINARREEIAASGSLFGEKRLLKAFPGLKHRDYQERINELRHRIKNREKT